MLARANEWHLDEELQIDIKTIIKGRELLSMLKSTPTVEILRIKSYIEYIVDSALITLGDARFNAIKAHNPEWDETCEVTTVEEAIERSTTTIS